MHGVLGNGVILTHTISVPELVWTVFCGGGLFYATKLFWRAIGDLKFLRNGGINFVREYSATTTIWIFTGMLLNQLIYVILGIVAMMMPTSGRGIHPLIYVLAGVFMFGSSVKTILAIVIERRKERLIQMLKHVDLLHSGKT